MNFIFKYNLTSIVITNRIYIQYHYIFQEAKITNGAKYVSTVQICMLENVLPKT